MATRVKGPDDCAVCLSGDSYAHDAIVFCENCNLAVHQQCYGIKAVPEGAWFCEVCKAPPPQPSTANIVDTSTEPPDMKGDRSKRAAQKGFYKRGGPGGRHWVPASKDPAGYAAYVAAHGEPKPPTKSKAKAKGKKGKAKAKAKGAPAAGGPPQCACCPIAGGALQPTADGRWCHASCVLLVPELYLEDPNSSGPVLGLDDALTKRKVKLRPVKIPQRTFQDWTPCFSQLRAGFSFPRIALRSHDRIRTRRSARANACR